MVLVLLINEQNQHKKIYFLFFNNINCICFRQSIKNLCNKLLEHDDLIKAHSVFTHAGMKPGIIEVKQGEFEAINKGIYYNTYYPSNIVAAPGDITEILSYYKL